LLAAPSKEGGVRELEAALATAEAAAEKSKRNLEKAQRNTEAEQVKLAREAKAVAAKAFVNRQRASLYNNKNRNEFNRRLATIRHFRTQLEKGQPEAARKNTQRKLNGELNKMKKFVASSQNKVARAALYKTGGSSTETLNERRARLRREWEREQRVKGLVKTFVNKLKAKRGATLGNARQVNAVINSLLNNIGGPPPARSRAELAALLRRAAAQLRQK
jgi:hypothetical protein